MGGKTWIYLGKFRFKSGQNYEIGRVELTNKSNDKDKYVTADAVRFGGRLAYCCRFIGKELWRGVIMTPEFVVTFAQEAIKVTILVSMPMLGLGLAVGLLISIFQAVTQIQEMTLTFVPKILVVLLGLLFFSNWMLQQLIDFGHRSIGQIPNLIP